MATKRSQIVSVALKLLGSESKGIGYADLARRLQEQLPEITAKTIYGTIWNLERRVPHQVCKPAKGIFLDVRFRQETRPEKEG